MLYLTRHGETQWNLEKRLQGRQDSPLTPKGIEDAKKLGERLASLPLEAVYSSSSGRAVQTAKHLLGGRELPIFTEDDLREIHLGEWEGQTTAAVEKAEGANYRNFWEAPHRYQPHLGESYHDVQERVYRVLDTLLERHPRSNVLVVTHAVVLKVILARYIPRPLERLWDSPFLVGTSLSLVQFDPSPRVVMEGDTSHIPVNE